ncbi:zonular occludens toxin domain-containing protein [Xanthomonas theicola]|uniref:Zona occludens toxin N-terminal domain-containing protein n=1 Tax=Xanthomonas theicola TaxID=56464 RepID=A0A2S6Z5V0_9XANT|nr:zonular occludens toxin domain-containing protein [Xanthomonas theicola]PPT76862.1 hypothetical protein XthCFBP4691_19505 [Xanthomonas theicola]QNH24713.1 hypothetical protein G4Q83_08120 [Xanthomonas theicola]
MPIEVFTGLPGNGKTLLMVEHLHKVAEQGTRPVFAAGIDGLKPGLATALDDPRDWNKRDADGNHLVPDGSLVYVDEAWKWFGHLHDASRQATPAHVLALAEHRHRGIDFVWTTQMPNQLYPFARALVANHHHVVRRFGTQLIDVYTWQELQEDVKGISKRDVALRKTRMLPKEHFADYTSATLHTIKRKIPFRVLALPAMAVAAAIFAAIAYLSLRPDTMAAKVTGAGPHAAQAASGQAGESVQRDRNVPRFVDATDYAKQHLPRFESMPWTAPVFDQRDITADPALYCMSSGEGLDGRGVRRGLSCTCYTEQSTVYDIAEGECRRIARRGPVYNPYRERREQEQQHVQQLQMPVQQSMASPGSVVERKARALGTFPESKPFTTTSATPETTLDM